MTLTVPKNLKICHIVHVDRLASIVADGFLWCDATIVQRQEAETGTTIGMNRIKKRRLEELTLTSYPDLHVGDCVPFYFCPRSVMLYMFHRDNNPEIDYHGGQEPIVHLVADLHSVVNWAEKNQKRWVFTLSNAGSSYFEDRCNLSQLTEIDWSAVNSTDWQSCKEAKQAEFLVEECFPWHLVESIGVRSDTVYNKVVEIIASHGHHPEVGVQPKWYY